MFLLPVSDLTSALARREVISGGVNLRILPLGDSITHGMSSSDGNGYRLALHDLLTPENQVEYIGQEHKGSMDNNRHEGHPGFDISPVDGVHPTDEGYRLMASAWYEAIAAAGKK